ncbi:MAG: ribosome biogenesis GTPase Der [Hyphomicrobiaceae bacterium]
MPATPTIAIVGRPNVGKSTLFNRMTGKRTALVSDLPGLTRDRKEGEAEIWGHMTRLVDTAGLEEAASGSIAARMRAQTELAIAEADLVLFVIDARAGVTPVDKEFARIVRNAGNKAILVANKCEGSKGTEGFYEAYALGLGEPVAISAEHGEGLSDLYGDIVAALGLEMDADNENEPDVAEMPPEEDDPTRPIKVAIVGRPNAGKSTLVNALLGEDRMITGPEPGLTRDSVASDLVWAHRNIKLFDTAGLRRRSKVEDTAEKLATSDTIRAIRFAEVVVLLVDAERGIEHQDLTIASMVADEGRALVIAINKWDLIVEKQKRLKEIHDTVTLRLAQMPGLRVVTLSALGERGLDKLMPEVLKAYDLWNKRISTNDLNRWLREAMDQHAPPATSGRRIKMRYMTQVSARPPTFIAFCSKPESLPDSYVRYLEKSLRKTFDFPGVPIRFNLRKGANPFADKRGG